ncbi:MAG TPA: hypothetical protein EYP57_04510 [Thermodesulfobacteriaceae bacterium]|nr:hypothetical protein [Thermodesulfobacteriaceae bacterium]
MRNKRRSRLDVIRSRGALRVGYDRDRLPFAFRNNNGAVVEYDMELVHALARDLDRGRIDVAVGGISMNPRRALRFMFSRSYRNE